jgi:hypothetical protein
MTTDTYKQLVLFPELEADTSTPFKYQILKFNDPTFKFNLTLTEQEDANAAALEQLGYFVVVETIAP